MKKIPPLFVRTLVKREDSWPSLEKLRQGIIARLNQIEESRRLVKQKLQRGVVYDPTEWIRVSAHGMEGTVGREKREIGPGYWGIAQRYSLDYCNNDSDVQNFFDKYNKFSYYAAFLKLPFMSSSTYFRDLKWDLDDVGGAYSDLRNFSNLPSMENYIEDRHKRGEWMERTKKALSELKRVIREKGAVISEKVPTITKKDAEEVYEMIMLTLRAAEPIKRTRSEGSKKLIEKLKKGELTLYYIYMCLVQDYEAWILNLEKYDNDIANLYDALEQHYNFVKKVLGQMEKVMARQGKLKVGRLL